MATCAFRSEKLEQLLGIVRRRDPDQPEFAQAVFEVYRSLVPVVAQHPKYETWAILERLLEPDRVISFRVAWQDDNGVVRVNRGYRVQFNNALGPYKGGLRFHPSVNLSILKFLGFEQIFKNSLTGLPMGGAKGGSDFDPKGKSDSEVMRFCQAFMTELWRHLGADTDVPAGDIGVGGREVGYMYGQYRRLANEVTGVFTGKGPGWGGSALRPEATGYGAIYFLQEMMRHRGEGLEGRTFLISGSGNVSQFAAEKVIELGGKVVTLSDSGGYIHDPHGLTAEKLEFVKDLKENRRGRIKEYAEYYECSYHAGETPWRVPADFAVPSATQNEIGVADARAMIANGVKAVVEGANMPTCNEAVDLFQEAGVLFAPGKAANAGGVAVSGLEMAQNSMRISWDRERVDRELHNIMRNIHRSCVEYGGQDGGRVDYVQGANVAGFTRLAKAMLSQGLM